MKLFFVYLFHLVYVWQQKNLGNTKHTALYASAALGILFGMNLMLISYLISFLCFNMVITFLRSYYIFTALALVLITVFGLLYKKRYEQLLTMASKQGKHINSKYNTMAIVFVVITILGHAFASYTLFNGIYFGK